MFDGLAFQFEVFPTGPASATDRPRLQHATLLSAERPASLFGKACLIREWGRIGYRGQVLIEPHDDEGKAITALMKVAATKRQNGATPSSPSTGPNRGADWGRQPRSWSAVPCFETDFGEDGKDVGAVYV